MPLTSQRSKLVCYLPRVSKRGAGTWSWALRFYGPHDNLSPDGKLCAETNIEKGMGSRDHSRSPPGSEEEMGPRKGTEESFLPTETQSDLQEPAHK